MKGCLRAAFPFYESGTSNCQDRPRGFRDFIKQPDICWQAYSGLDRERTNRYCVLSVRRIYNVKKWIERGYNDKDQ